MPGDRLNKCLGLLKPIGIENLKILIKSSISVKSHELHKNIMANDDDYNIIIELSKNN